MTGRTKQGTFYEPPSALSTLLALRNLVCKRITRLRSDEMRLLVYEIFRRRFRLFELNRNSTTEEPRRPDMRSAEYRLEVVQKQLVRQILHVKLKIH